MQFATFVVICLSLVAGFSWLYRILVSIKKRYKSIESRLHNMNNWVVTGNESIMQHLEKIKEIVFSLHAGAKVIDLKENSKEGTVHSPRPAVQSEPGVLLNREQRISSLYYREDSLNHVFKNDEVKYYYLAILEELQCLNKTINTSQLQQHKSDHFYTDQPGFTKNDIVNQVNAWPNRINKRI